MKTEELFAVKEIVEANEEILKEILVVSDPGEWVEGLRAFWVKMFRDDVSEVSV